MKECTMKETFPEVLQRLALAHLERKTHSYIKELEEIAEAASLVVSQADFERIHGAEKLKSALEKLKNAA